jgi:hypothetical protein
LFEDIVKFEGEVIFNKDAAGKVTVLAGESEVVIEFEGAYSTEPVITVTPNENTEVRYYVTNVTSQGFTLKVDPSVIEDTKFFWQAVRVDDSN